MGGLVTEWLWPYKLQPTRFFKTPNGLVPESRSWPYNRGNTVTKKRVLKKTRIKTICFIEERVVVFTNKRKA